MEPSDGRTWQEAAASARERIRALERDAERTTATLHTLRGEVAATRYLGEKITELAANVQNLAGRFDALSRHSVQRPSQTTLQVLGQYAGLIIAIIALWIAAK